MQETFEIERPAINSFDIAFTPMKRQCCTHSLQIQRLRHFFNRAQPLQQIVLVIKKIWKRDMLSENSLVKLAPILDMKYGFVRLYVKFYQMLRKRNRKRRQMLMNSKMQLHRIETTKYCIVKKFHRPWATLIWLIFILNWNFYIRKLLWNCASINTSKFPKN